MKKSLGIVLVVILIAFWCFYFFDKKKSVSKLQLNDMPKLLVENENSTYTVDTEIKEWLKWENIFVYDSDWELVFSLKDSEEVYYFFVLYKNFLVLDKWIGSLDSNIVVYNVKTGNLIFETDYYPWEKWLIINDDKIEFYKRIDESLLSDSSLIQCDGGEAEKVFVEKYLYNVWDISAINMGDVQCI